MVTFDLNKPSGLIGTGFIGASISAFASVLVCNIIYSINLGVGIILEPLPWMALVWTIVGVGLLFTAILLLSINARHAEIGAGLFPFVFFIVAAIIMLIVAYVVPTLFI